MTRFRRLAAELVDELRELTGEHPLREGSRALLIQKNDCGRRWRRPGERRDR